MTFYKSDWIVVVCAAALLFGGKLADGISLGGGVSTPTIEAPSAELQAIVQPIAAMVTGEHAAVDRAELSAYRLALAEFHDRDDAEKVKTTARLEAFNKTALRSLWLKTGMEDRYPSMWSAVDKSLAGYIGIPMENDNYKAVDFTRAMAAKTVEFYSALAWAFQQES